MRQKNIDLLLIMGAVILNIVWTVFPLAPHFIGIITSLPIVLFAPGYLLCDVVFQKRILDPCYHITFSLAVSVAVVIVSGLGLNLLPIGLNVATWTLLLATLITALCLATFYLRHKAQAKNVGAQKFHFAMHDYVLMALAIVIVLVSFQYSANSVLHQPDTGYTQLWMLPSQQDPNSWTINLGMQSEEHTVKQYQLTIIVNGRVLKTWPSVSLAPKSMWKQQLSLIPDKTGTVSASARLYLLDAPNVVYREVHVNLQKK